jgi:hypothetical protein
VSAVTRKEGGEVVTLHCLDAQLPPNCLLTLAHTLSLILALVTASLTCLPAFLAAQVMMQGCAKSWLA